MRSKTSKQETASQEGKKPIIGIIGGTGRFGGWFKGFFEDQGFTVLISGRKTELQAKELAEKSDIVIVSVPITETQKIIKEIRNFVRADALLCDFTSVKEIPLKAMLGSRSGCGVLGMHPLFGPLVPSLKSQTIIFCHGKDNHWVKFLKETFERAGAAVISTNPKNHDSQMAVVQALTHFTNIVFAKTIQRQKFDLSNIYSTPVFRLQSILVGRVLGGNPELYADLEMENPVFMKIVKQYLAEVKQLVSYLAKKNKKGFVKDFQEAASFMEHFIPIAQAKSVELISLMDRQPIELKKFSGQVKFSAKNKIAYLGPEGTFSNQATSYIFPKNSDQLPAATIGKVFELLDSGEADFGVVPIENSTEGLVQETLDNLLKYPLRIVGSYTMPIHLCLLARTTDPAKIKIIKSHAQPIAQSRNWLEKNFPKIKTEAESSSVKAILTTQDEEVAFISSHEAAARYGLKILAENIEDKKTNATQFYILAKKETPVLSKILKADKTILILAVHDRSGVLRDILNHFADKKLNLSKLYSRKSEADGWDYYFLFEVESLPEDDKLREVLKKIKPYCSIVRVLGRA
ncbi:MAG: prephenate dehydratase [Candidatus Vogelbacteria bacterium]|nr:prephenate dehydratase [Candidatus Vogelbacteria bacterium]